MLLLLYDDGVAYDWAPYRKTIYLCIMSSLNFEECVHKILKLNIKVTAVCSAQSCLTFGFVQEGNEVEVSTMLIDCCAMVSWWL